MTIFYDQDQHVIEKMTNVYQNNKVTYFLKENMDIVPGMHIMLKHTGRYQCVSCKKILKKIYSGFCYVCLTQKAMADTCVMAPNRCHYLKGTCREPKWGENFCFKPHFIYLAYTDKFKVGLTRQTHIPYRWMDQGATIAAILSKVTSRYQAGMIEKSLMEILSDKSHWQNMLKSGNSRPSKEDFLNKWLEVQDWLKKKIQAHPDLIVETSSELHISKEIEILNAPEIFEMDYPLDFIPEKIKSVSLEKEPIVSDEIIGIKGQYLIFRDRVLNVRSHEGAIVSLQLYS